MEERDRAEGKSKKVVRYIGLAALVVVVLVAMYFVVIAMKNNAIAKAQALSQQQLELKQKQDEERQKKQDEERQKKQKHPQKQRSQKQNLSISDSEAMAQLKAEKVELEGQLAIEKFAKEALLAQQANKSAESTKKRALSEDEQILARKDSYDKYVNQEDAFKAYLIEIRRYTGKQADKRIKVIKSICKKQKLDLFDQRIWFMLGRKSMDVKYPILDAKENSDEAETKGGVYQNDPDKDQRYDSVIVTESFMDSFYKNRAVFHAKQVKKAMKTANKAAKSYKKLQAVPEE